MCNPCLSASKYSGTSDTCLIEIPGKNEVSTFSQTRERGGAEEVGRGNASLTTIASPNKETFSLNNKKIKNDEKSLSLNELITKNNERLIIGHLNINFIENKFEAFVSLVKDKLDIIMISETKIDESFPVSQFIIEGYSKPFRRDRNSNGGRILMYVRDDIPCKEIKTHKLPDDIEGMFIEINLRKKKWIIIGYNHQKESICYFFNPNQQRIG